MSRKAFNTRWAQAVENQNSSTVFQEPDNTRLTTGWEGGADKDAPPAGQENWWHNRVDSALQGVERTGVMAYHPQAIYGAGAPTYASDGNYYESIEQSNTGNDPVTTTGFWRFVGSSFFSGSEPGDVKMVAHTGIPSPGWLKCNGAAILRSSYPRLFSKIGISWNTGGESTLQFRVPDYRGEFIRGFTDGSPIDIGRVFGSGQMYSVESHTHPARQYLGLNGITGDQAVAPYSGGSGTALPTGAVGHYGGAETRPRNKTANYWIKY